MSACSQDSELVGNGYPPCSRCMNEASRRHDKKRWWCKFCRKPFTAGTHICQVCNHVTTKDKRFGQWVCSSCSGSHPRGDYPLVTSDRSPPHVQILEDYSSVLLFGLRHPSALNLYEQNAMQTVFQDLLTIHGTDAFARSLYGFLYGSGKDDILHRINELFHKFGVESMNCTV